MSICASERRRELEQREGTRDVVVGPFAAEPSGVVYVSLHQEAQAPLSQQHTLFTKENLYGHHIETSLFSCATLRQLEDLYRVNHPRAIFRCGFHMEAQAMLILSGQFIGFLRMGDGYVERGGDDAGAAQHTSSCRIILQPIAGAIKTSR